MRRAVRGPHGGRESAAHHQPHHHLDTLRASLAQVLDVLDASSGLRISYQQVEEALVELGIPQTRSLTLKLVRETAGADHQDPLDPRVRLDRSPDRLAQHETAMSSGGRV